MEKLKAWLLKAREVSGILVGGTATLVVVLTVIGVVLVGKLIIWFVKFLCLPFIVVASLVYPDERNWPLHERIWEDIRAWWHTVEPASF